MTRIVIVDDHPIVREGLTAALDGKNGLEVTGAFASASQAIASLGRTKPDVVILDLDLSGSSGLEAIGTLHDRAAVLVLTAYGSDDDLQTALRSGAKGYLLKGVSLDEIERAIDTVSRGESYIDPRASSALIAGGRPLSRREREVLGLIAEGQSNKQIAAKLRITERTAKFHVTSILNKLGADNRAQAVALAAERHLL
jgi:DNA-binding NarL/FixJ family response regulator